MHAGQALEAGVPPVQADTPGAATHTSSTADATVAATAQAIGAPQRVRLDGRRGGAPQRTVPPRHPHRLQDSLPSWHCLRLRGLVREGYGRVLRAGTSAASGSSAITQPTANPGESLATTAAAEPGTAAARTVTAAEGAACVVPPTVTLASTTIVLHHSTVVEASSAASQPIAASLGRSAVPIRGEWRLQLSRGFHPMPSVLRPKRGRHVRHRQGFAEGAVLQLICPLEDRRSTVHARAKSGRSAPSGTHTHNNMNMTHNVGTRRGKGTETRLTLVNTIVSVVL